MQIKPSRKPKTLITLCFLLFGTLIFLFILWQEQKGEAARAKIEMSDRFIAGLPSEIEADGLLMRNVKTGFIHSLIPDSCGVNAIRITDATVSRIKVEGLAFFHNATRSRSNPDPRHRTVFYRNWREMRPMKSLAETVIMAVLDCGGRSNIPAESILKGIKDGTGYVAGSGYNQYYVLPDQKLFVQAFID